MNENKLTCKKCGNKRNIPEKNKIKTLDDLKERLGITDAEIHDAVNWVELIEQHFFNSHSKKDYRIQTIEFCTNNRINFHVTDNNEYEMLTHFVHLTCPVCKSEMKPNGGGGNSDGYSVTYRCAKCKIDGTIAISVPEGISFTFKENE